MVQPDSSSASEASMRRAMKQMGKPRQRPGGDSGGKGGDGDAPVAGRSARARFRGRLGAAEEVKTEVKKEEVPKAPAETEKTYASGTPSPAARKILEEKNISMLEEAREKYEQGIILESDFIDLENTFAFEKEK